MCINQTTIRKFQPSHVFATIDSARHSRNKQTYHNTQWTFEVQTIILHVKFWLYTFSNHIGQGSL